MDIKKIACAVKRFFNKLMKILEYGGQIEDRKNYVIYTCFHCPDAQICKYAWDDYNTNGDCLASK